MDTTIIYNYSESNSKDVLFSPNFNDTLSLTITEGKEYLSDLKLQGEIKYPSSYDNQQFYFNTDGIINSIFYLKIYFIYYITSQIISGSHRYVFSDYKPLFVSGCFYWKKYP